MRERLQLGPGWADEAHLARAWRSADPFPHLVIDDFLAPACLDELMAILDEEGVERYEADLYAFDATAPEPRTEEMRALRTEWARKLAPGLSRITGKHVVTADLRAYAYRAGDFLLPHADHQEGLERRLAFAYYLPAPEPIIGGELELYRCRASGGELADIESARLVEARGNRISIFDVSDISLHQVREVLGGVRLSLSGWFYP